MGQPEESTSPAGFAGGKRASAARSTASGDGQAARPVPGGPSAVGSAFDAAPGAAQGPGQADMQTDQSGAAAPDDGSGVGGR
eukprot:10615180-Lingulodinium_polyedra.AAC.1